MFSCSSYSLFSYALYHTIDIQRQKGVLLDICHRLELVVNICLRILDVDCRKVVLSWVVLKFFHEQHSQTRVGQVAFESSLFDTLADLEE